MSTDWIKHKREHWPEGSLEKTLLRDFPGCKTLKEALAQAIKDRQELLELKKKLNEEHQK